MKHLRYLRYVIRHKWFVLVAGMRLRVPLWQLIVHDWTKFLPSEWTPYADFFYNEKRKSREGLDAIGDFGCAEAAPWGYFLKDRFDLAWLYHQRRNKHHWQWWVLREDEGGKYPLPMPERHLREMVADWAGAGRAITGRWELAEWYAQNRDKMLVRDQARVEELVQDFEERIR